MINRSLDLIWYLHQVLIHSRSPLNKTTLRKIRIGTPEEDPEHKWSSTITEYYQFKNISNPT